MSRKHPVCLDLEPDLIAAATGEAGAVAVERVDAHVTRCAPCREDFARYRAVDATVGALRAAAPPDADADVARARLRARRPPSTRGSGRSCRSRGRAACAG